MVCELGNDKPEPMLINLDYSWSGPAGTVLTMKDLRLIADCTAMGGAPRVRAHITTISYDLPDGSHCSVPVDGWAVDDVVGEAGAIGVWNWNLSAVAPLGMLDGVLGGLAGLLQPTQQTTSVNTNITIQQTETTPLKNTGEGAAVGLNNSVGKHLEEDAGEHQAGGRGGQQPGLHGGDAQRCRAAHPAGGVEPAHRRGRCRATHRLRALRMPCPTRIR